MASPEEDLAPLYVRKVPLLQGEQVQQRFDTHRGLMESTPERGPLLVLTTQRLMAFTHGRDYGQGLLIGLEDLHAAAVDLRARRLPQLLRGLALVLLGVAVYLFVGLFVVTTGSALIPAIIGGVVSLAGALLVARFILWERQGAISFMAAHSGPWQLSFEYRGDDASDDAALVVACFFHLKQQQLKHGQALMSGEDAEDDWPYTPWVR